VSKYSYLSYTWSRALASIAWSQHVSFGKWGYAFLLHHWCPVIMSDLNLLVLEGDIERFNDNKAYALQLGYISL